MIYRSDNFNTAVEDDRSYFQPSDARAVVGSAAFPTPPDHTSGNMTDAMVKVYADAVKEAAAKAGPGSTWAEFYLTLAVGVLSSVAVAWLYTIGGYWQGVLSGVLAGAAMLAFATIRAPRDQ